MALQSKRISEAIISLTFALILLAAPLPCQGQQPVKVLRIGWLGVGDAAVPTDKCPLQGGQSWQGWMEGLRERGYIPGQNVVMECRWTEGREERAPALAAELVSLPVDILVASGSNQVRAAKQATTTIPIVMIGVMDPVRRGLVSSFAHPGGNVTGLADDAGLGILGKRLELLTQTVPRASSVAVLWFLGPSYEPSWERMLEVEAQALGVTLLSYRITGPEELEGAFAAMAKHQAKALLVEPHPSMEIVGGKIIELAARHRLPAMYQDRYLVEAGGLMAYAVKRLDIGRGVAAIVERVLRGSKPSDLPVEQPTSFELVINIKTANALELTIPRSLLIQAAEVIR